MWILLSHTNLFPGQNKTKSDNELEIGIIDVYNKSFFENSKIVENWKDIVGRKVFILFVWLR